MSTTTSIKCSQCGLVNFAEMKTCKRCNAELVTTPIQAAPVQSQAEWAESSEQLHSDLKAELEKLDEQLALPGLVPCPDCGRNVSRKAEACPRCGSSGWPFVVRHAPVVVESREGAEMLGLSVVIGIVSILCLLAGLGTMVGPSSIVGGDAFNYIIAAGRGTVWACVGAGLAVLSAGFGISATVVRKK